MFYFGYGSNMPRARLEDRLGPFEHLGAAHLTGYTLRFHKESLKDHSGKCDAFHTGDPDDRLWGALDRLTDGQFARLDRIKGSGYRRVPVTVTFRGQAVEAALYVAKSETVNPDLRPLGWYKRHVLVGARELNLPRKHIDAIEAVPTISDPR